MTEFNTSTETDTDVEDADTFTVHDLRDHYLLSELQDPQSLEKEIARLDGLVDTMKSRTPKHAARLENRRDVLKSVRREVACDFYPTPATWDALEKRVTDR